MINFPLFYQLIYDRVVSEETELVELSNQGVFYAPELYWAFQLGKTLKKNEVFLFDQRVKWIRERDFGNGGPTDIAFATEHLTYVLELKLRDSVHSYSADISKLKKLEGQFEKYFVAMVDSWATEQDKDGRISQLEKEHPEIKRVAHFQSFPTRQDWYKKEIHCTVCVWHVPGK